jgi:hypothetical protein
MSRRLSRLIALFLLLGFADLARADDFYWDNSSGDSLWRNPQNWDLNKLPSDGDALYVDWLRDPTEVIIDAGTDARCESITLSNDSVGGQGYVHLHITGGTLTAGNLIRIGREELATFTIDDGDVTCSAFQLGRKEPSKGVVYINGGTVTVATNTRVPRGGSQGSELHLNGGILYTDGLVMNDPNDPLSGTNGRLDITGGVMVLTRQEDQTEKIKQYVQNGWIAAYGVKSGELLPDGRLASVQMDYDVTNPGMTTVWATASGATQARAPQPQDGATVQLIDAKAVSWLAGDGAVWHDVYFGSDQEAVTDANTSDATGIYRGRQDTTGYILSETLEWGGTYFWRVDEIEADGTVHAGPVWSFTVADYLLVDDFEGYDAGDNAIWFTWKDGLGYGQAGQEPYYAGNGTGSAVGDEGLYTYPAEITVHSGLQSMAYTYNNNQEGFAKYSEAQKSLSYPRDWTEQGVAELSLWFRGYPTYVGGFVEGPVGTYTMTAAGEDIWGAADQFHFAFKEISGAGTIQARVLSVGHTDDWAKAGVMIRDSLDPNAAHAMVAVTPANGVWFGRRDAAGQSSTSIKQDGITAPQWVKLERSVGGLVRAYYSADGVSWTPLGSPEPVIMNAPIYIGLALTSHNPDAACEAKFSDVSFPDTSVDAQWAHQDVGIIANVPEPIYLAVTDGAGAPAIVYHDDANAAVIDTWTQWVVPLQTFADQGVSLTDVDQIAIGIGTKGNMTTPGGSGRMYFDDIRLYRFGESK